MPLAGKEGLLFWSSRDLYSTDMAPLGWALSQLLTSSGVLLPAFMLVLLGRSATSMAAAFSECQVCFHLFQSHNDADSWGSFYLPEALGSIGR